MGPVGLAGTVGIFCLGLFFRVSMTPSMGKLGLKTHLRQGMQQRQEMILAPRMLQSIEILALPRADLDSWLAEEAQKNEALAVGDLTTGERLEPSRSSAAAT